MRRQRISLFLTLILLLALGVGLLRGQQVAPAHTPSTPTVGTPVAQPSTIVVNQTTLVTVTSQITAPSSNPVVPGSVKLERVDSRGKVLATLGTMVDNGTQGDAVAGDGIFTLRVTFTEPTPGTVRLQVSATFRAGGQRVTSAVALIPVVGNTPPVANAGPDQTVVVGQAVTLDGSASTDADGDPLQYRWSFVARPTGSQTTLSGPTLVHPTFVVDRPGRYTVQLIVNDGKVDSAPDAVAVTTINALPVANAGPDQTVAVGAIVTLDGSQSSDVDGDPLLFLWSFTQVPSGSLATLSDPTAVHPAFVVDKPGTYRVQLIVNDGFGNSAPDTVTITTQNSRPVANAGANQTVSVGTTVTLDGSASSDIDGNPLTFRWTWTTVPTGSTATLANPTAVHPTFGVDKPGTYVAQLIVNDGTVDSLPTTVTITTQNSRPVANAGANQTVFVGITVTLDGSASSDVDGNPLTFRWALTTAPAGSLATLSDLTAVHPTFGVDKPGTYVAQLIVNDGTVDSLPTTVTITTQNSRPVANAGPAQTVFVGTTVTLDGSASSDVDGNPLTFRWALTTAPAGSAATLSAPTAVTPTFVVDKPGTYVAQLIVNDGTVDSLPATVTITTQNSRPVANAGPAQTVLVGTTATLDGSASSDVDGDFLTFRWALTTIPTGSAATLSAPMTVHPTFEVDKPGTYMAQLIVNDGTVDSLPATVSISTGNSQPDANAGTNQTVFVRATVHLNGSASSDADGDALSYRWSFTTVPAGSQATLSDPTAIQPMFVVDLPGTYVVQLIVNDGTLDSAPATVRVTTVNRPPILASIGNRTVVLGNTLVLQLTATDPDGDPLTFAVDPLSANASLDATTGRFTFTPGASQVGTLVLTFKVSDGQLAAEAPVTVTVTECPPPTITAITPLTGPVGTEVTITGTNLNCGTAPTLTLNGVPAIITSLSSTEIKTSIPLGGEGGLFAFSTPGGMVTVPQTLAFNVVLSRDFALAVVPGSGQVLQGATTTYTVELQRLGSASFTGLAALAVTGGPSGVTATLASPMLTAGQKTTLTVSAAPTALVGTSTLTLQATTTVDTKSVTRTATFVLDVQAGGRTAVVGQFTLLDGTPLAGVKLVLSGKNTQTDSGGNFQLLDVPEGTNPLSIDTTPVNPQLPMYGMDVTAVAGQITQLPPFRIHPPLPPERFTPIQNATQDQVIADPRFPGASFTLPAGVTIIGWDGTPKTQMAIQRLNLDELPVPPPPGFTRSVYQPFFGTPMGGLPSAPIPVTLPNDLDLHPGDKAELWYYDAAPFPGVPGAWRLAGMGTVSQDGATIASDPGVGIQRFCGVCGLSCFVKNQETQPNRNACGSPQAADPVDLFLGQMILDKADLVLPGRMPVAIQRTCNPLDPFGGIAGFQLGFGPGWAPSTEVVLQEETPSLRRLIFPGNARSAFVLQGENSFINTTEPRFAGAVLTADGQGGHSLRLKNGTVWRFASGWLARANPRPLVGIGLPIEHTDPHGNRLTIERDAFGGITRLIDAVGREVTFTLNTAGLITDITDPLSRTVRYGYNSAGRLETVTDPAGGVTRYTYDAAGQILTITDPRGIVVARNEYGATKDGQVRLLRQEQADGGVWVFDYLFSGGGPGTCFVKPEGVFCSDPPPPIHIGTRVIDPRGHATTHLLTPDGFTRQSTDALGQTTQFARDYGGRLVRTTDPLGRITQFAYDTAGNVKLRTDPAGTIWRFEYEPIFNRLSTLTDPLGNLTTLTYDAQGNLTSVTDPLGQVNQIAYNAFGQPTSLTDPLGNITTLTYDAQGNLAAIADPLGHTTEQVYDAVSRLIAQTDPLGRTTHFAYDALNRRTEMVDALGGVTRFTYDANGNLLTVTDALGHTTTYEYDTRNQLTRRTDPVGASETFEYDTMGNLIRHTDRKGQVTTFEYDALNRRTEASYADGTIATFTYDAAGRLIRASNTAGGDILQTYDVLDRLIQQITGLGTVEYAYDTRGLRTAMRVPGQATVTYGYDNSSRLTEIIQGSQRVDFAYDALGRRTRVALPNTVATVYSYDAASRLTELLYRNASGMLGNLTYHYDATGNRTQVSGSFARTLLPAPVASATYDPANRQVTFDTTQLTYDANGNLTSDGTKSYHWDARDRLIELSGPGLIASFQYDALARRSIRVVNGVSTAFLYDGATPVQEQSNGTITANMLTGLGIDEYFVRSDATGTRTLLADALGSTAALLDPAGTVQTIYTYEPFGTATAIGEANANTFQYTGRENDQTGLFYYRARYYKPQFQRFVNEDPIGLAGGINTYAYVYNDPLNLIDPIGLASGSSRNGLLGSLILILQGKTGKGPYGGIGKVTSGECGYRIGCAFVGGPGGLCSELWPSPRPAYTPPPYNGPFPTPQPNSGSGEGATPPPPPSYNGPFPTPQPNSG
jgi:RHS repeat-associated protein